MTKVIGNYLTKSSQSGMTEEAAYRGMQTPSHYKPINLDVVKQRTINWKIIKPTQKQIEQSKLNKDNSPAPTSYKPEKAIDRLKQRPVQVQFSKS